MNENCCLGLPDKVCATIYPCPDMDEFNEDDSECGMGCCFEENE